MGGFSSKYVCKQYFTICVIAICTRTYRVSNIVRIYALDYYFSENTINTSGRSYRGQSSENSLYVMDRSGGSDNTWRLLCFGSYNNSRIVLDLYTGYSLRDR